MNATVISKAGALCSLDDVKAGKQCIKTEAFDAKMHKLISFAEEKFSKLLRMSSSLKASSGNVCASLAPSIPSDMCSCANNAGGAVVNCAANIGSEDVIYLNAQLEVCADPASVSITLKDSDTGYEFTTEITSGDTGSIPTGIMIGVPEVGEAEIVLMYKLLGNIDQLQLQLGFDLSVTVFGYTQTCSSYYPSKCPLWVFDETIPFGSYC
jgi:hypothetical protein